MSLHRYYNMVCKCGCGKEQKPGNMFLIGHSHRFPKGNTFGLENLKKAVKYRYKKGNRPMFPYEIGHKRTPSGDKHWNWLADEVGKGGLHRWIRIHKIKPDKCEMCEKRPPYDLANVTGVYNRDINNFRYLCRSCHFRFDFFTGERKPHA